MKTLVMANQKGGVGKTISAVALATAFAQAGRRVLLVDCDPSAQATLYFQASKDTTPSFADVLLDNFDGSARLPMSETLVKTVVPNLKLAPGHRRLNGFSINNAQAGYQVLRIQEALQSVAADFDVAVVDTQGADGLLQQAALFAADMIALVLQGQPSSLVGMEDTLKIVYNAQAVQRHFNRVSEIIIFLTMVERRVNIGQLVRAKLADTMPAALCRNVIHKQVAMEECLDDHVPIQIYAPKSSGAREYAALAEEIGMRLFPARTHPQSARRSSTAMKSAPSARPKNRPAAKKQGLSKERG